MYKANEGNVYDKQIYIENYEVHNQEVKVFFGESSNFLHLVLSRQDAPERLAKFLGHRIEEINIPHLNRTQR